MVAFFSNVRRSILNGTPSEVFRKRTREDGSLCTMTMRDLTLYHKPAPSKTSKWSSLTPNDSNFVHHGKNAWSTIQQDAVEAFKNRVY